MRKNTYFENVIWYWNDKDKINPFWIIKYINDFIFVGNFIEVEKIGVGLEWKNDSLFLSEFKKNEQDKFWIQFFFDTISNFDGKRYYIGDFEGKIRTGNGL